jgi:hypothetical protein
MVCVSDCGRAPWAAQYGGALLQRQPRPHRPEKNSEAGPHVAKHTTLINQPANQAARRTLRDVRYWSRTAPAFAQAGSSEGGRSR